LEKEVRLSAAAQDWYSTLVKRQCSSYLSASAEDKNPQIVSMVRPTGTKDVPSCNNRFAALDENYYDSLNRRNLTDATTTQGKPPLPPPLTGRKAVHRQGTQEQLTAAQLMDPESKQYGWNPV
jgi:hypothetical protein